MRLINADTLPKYTGYALSAGEVAMAVENAPTIDAVEVVRCKDCKWWERDYQPLFPRDERPCNILGMGTLPDWFCADGERRDG